MATAAFPPGPSGWPVLGSLRAFRRDPLGFLYRNAYEIGPITQYRVGSQQVYLVNDVDLIQDILVTHSPQFTIGRILRKMSSLLGEGLLTSTGEFHIRQRRLMQPAFHRERLMGYGREMIECALRARERWQDGQEMDLADEMMRVTMAVVGRTLFSADVEQAADRIGKALHEILAVYPRLFLPYSQLLMKLPLASNRRYNEAKSLLDQTILSLIAERRASGVDTGDLLSMLLLAQEEGTGGMTDQQVRDESLTLFLAGHETTANALTWTFTLLAQHPEVRAKLDEELATVLGGRPPAVEDVPRLKYAEQVLTEGIRLYPPAWVIGRRPLAPYRLREFEVSPEAVILVSPYVMQRNPAYYAEPERFHPERWTPEFREQLPKFAYFPFGGGPRLCIGERFAWMEGILVMATLAQRWRFTLLAPEEVQPRALVTLRTRHGVKVRAQRVEERM